MVSISYHSGFSEMTLFLFSFSFFRIPYFLKPILHFALVFGCGKVCEEKSEKNASGSCFDPMYSVI